MLFGMEHAWRGVTFLCTLCSLHIHLMFVRLQALCLINHTEDVPACPQRACGLERKVRSFRDLMLPASQPLGGRIEYSQFAGKNRNYHQIEPILSESSY